MKKSTLKPLSCIMLSSLLFASHVSAYTGTVVSDELYVRAGADSSADIVGSLAYGDTVEITYDCGNGWYEIYYNGDCYYVSGSYVSVDGYIDASDYEYVGGSYDWDDDGYESSYDEDYDEDYEDYDESYDEDYDEDYEDYDESYDGDYDEDYEDYDGSYDEDYVDYESYDEDYDGESYDEDDESYDEDDDESYDESYDEDDDESYDEDDDESYDEDDESYDEDDDESYDEDDDEAYDDDESDDEDDASDDEEDAVDDEDDAVDDEDDEDDGDGDGERSSAEGTYLGNFTLTGYCNCASCCGTAGNATASGVMPSSGHTVAMGGVPFGTQLLINGTVYTVEDRGTPYGHVDIYFDSHDQALAFGMQSADVYQIG